MDRWHEANLVCRVPPPNKEQGQSIHVSLVSEPSTPATRPPTDCPGSQNCCDTGGHMKGPCSPSAGSPTSQDEMTKSKGGKRKKRRKWKGKKPKTERRKKKKEKKGNRVRVGFDTLTRGKPSQPPSPDAVGRAASKEEDGEGERGALLVFFSA